MTEVAAITVERAGDDLFPRSMSTSIRTTEPNTGEYVPVILVDGVEHGYRVEPDRLRRALTR